MYICTVEQTCLYTHVYLIAFMLRLGFFFFTQKGYYSILLFYPMYLRKFLDHPMKSCALFKNA